MSEKSMLWGAPTSGDGAAGYTEAETTQLFGSLVGASYATEGVLFGIGGQLAVTGSASPLSVTDGKAWICGYFYWNTGAVNVTVPTPVVGTTGHRVVLQWLASSRTVRITLISSSDGVPGYPALTQTPGVKWEIPLANLTITTGGVITLADARAYCHFATAVKASMIDDNSVNDSKVGDRVPQFTRRQGGSATIWSTVGVSSYTPNEVMMQVGAASMTLLEGNEYADLTVTFPLAFSQPPLVFVTFQSAPMAGEGVWLGVTGAAGTYAQLRAYRENTLGEWQFTVSWLAVGAR